MYDLTDEALDQTFESLLRFLRTMPNYAAKQTLAAILEETALLDALLRESGGEAPEGEGYGEALARLWDRIDEGRNLRAHALLQNLMRQEG